MSIVNESIFRVYDIRGKYPDEINEEAVFKISAALVEFLNPDKLIVAHDGRKSSELLKESVMTAIMASGADVIDIGLASSPLFYFTVNRLAAGGGVMITASHNPPDYNGLKLVREKAILIGQSNGLSEIKKTAENIVINKIRKGEVIKKDLSKEYENYLFKKAGIDKEPEIKDIRFEFDSDSDRLLVYEKGKQIRADLLSGVIIKDFLDKKSFLSGIFRKPIFIYDFRFSKAIPEYILQSGGEAICSRVGHFFIKEAMRRNRAFFGAELSGHFYFKDVFYVEVPILMKLKLLKIMNETGESLAELIKPFEKYFHSGEINIEASDQKQAASLIQRLKENYKDGKIDELDGITIGYPTTSFGTSWWFNLRPSNTEPVLRLVVEAETQYVLDQKIKEISDFIEQRVTP
ncbi:MAG: hypothetical protein AAB338_00065 [Patescibacteria group bacterium]